MNSFRISQPVVRGLMQVRGMATEKQLKLRIVGTKNIAKITKSMKMVSAAKLRGDQQRLAAAQPFASWAATITGAPKNLEGLSAKDFPAKNLVIAMTTDKGLCGGVNSILCRMVKTMFLDCAKEGKVFDCYILGDKGRGQLRRILGPKLAGSATERSLPYTFDLAAAITSEFIASEYDAIHLCYNEFRSAIVYIPSIKSITPLTDPTSVGLYKFQVEPALDAETLQNFYEYTLATQLYHSLLQNATAEQSSRMTAMENASKNAGEMIEKLSLKYNRARQTRITTELIEIISGASALKGN